MTRPSSDIRLTWLLTALCVLTLGLAQTAGAAWAQDDDQPAATAPLVLQDDAAQLEPASAAPSSAAAGQSQVAAAAAEAIQQAPANIAISVQVLSPGNSGPVTQANVATAEAQAVNVAQSGTAAGAAEAAQPVTAGQGAAAVAQSTQDSPANVYIPVSILSPGDHGPVTQVNVSSALAVATNVAQVAAQPGTPSTGAVDQNAGAAGAAAQGAPQNFAAPVTVGGVEVGDHPASEPWVWSWVWELDCGSGALPPVAALGPIIAEVTGGAWEWDWTWTCAPAAGAPAGPPPADRPPDDAPVAVRDTAPGAQPQVAHERPAATSPAATPRSGPAPLTIVSQSATQRRHPRPRGADTRRRLVATGVLTRAGLQPIADAVATLGRLAAASGEPPTTADSSGKALTHGASGPRPAAPPAPTPTLFAAGASGGSGPGPPSIGLAALIGAFLLTVPRLGTRARTQLVHRSPQALPDPRHRPG